MTVFDWTTTMIHKNRCIPRRYNLFSKNENNFDIHLSNISYSIFVLPSPQEKKIRLGIGAKKKRKKKKHCSVKILVFVFHFRNCISP